MFKLIAYILYFIDILILVYYKNVSKIFYYYAKFILRKYFNKYYIKNIENLLHKRILLNIKVINQESKIKREYYKKEERK